MSWKSDNLKLSYKMNTLIVPFITAMMMIGFASTAQSAAYIKFDGIDGEALDNDHQGWSDILSIGQAVHQPNGGATGQSRRRGSVIVEDMRLEMSIDSASPILFNAARMGRVIPKVEVELCQGESTSVCNPDRLPTQHCYYKYELANVLVTSYQVNASGQDSEAGGRGTTALSLNFEEIKQEYTPAPKQCPADHSDQ